MKVWTTPCLVTAETEPSRWHSQANAATFLYILKIDIVNRHRHALPKSGKGRIRYSSPQKMEFALIGQMLRETVEDTSETCA
jgi:hypothetical protein